MFANSPENLERLAADIEAEDMQVAKQMAR